MRQDVARSVEGKSVAVVAGIEADLELRAGARSGLGEGPGNQPGPCVERCLHGSNLAGGVGCAGSHEPANLLLRPGCAPEDEGIAVLDSRSSNLVRFEIGQRTARFAHQLQRLERERARLLETIEGLETSQRERHVGAQQIRLAPVRFEVPKATEELLRHRNQHIALTLSNDRRQRITILESIELLVVSDMVKPRASRTSPERRRRIYHARGPMTWIAAA